MTTTGRAAGTVPADVLTVWRSMSSAAGTLTGDMLALRPSARGGAAVFSFQPDRDRAGWQGFLHSLDADELERERNYRLTARSGDVRCSATVTVRITPETADTTSIDIACAVTTVAGPGLPAQQLADEWLAALQSRSAQWNRLTRPAQTDRHRSGAGRVAAGLALTAGLAAGTAISLLRAGATGRRP